jgi:shikimate dehydrogenase
MTNLLGLIGYPLSHSFSENYFKEKFTREGILNWQYKNFPISDIRQIRNIFERNPNLKGLNVTIPYKEQVIPFLDHLEGAAKDISAVNTILITRSNQKQQLTGYNTDVTGFERSLIKNNVEMGEKALMLGTGGASKAAEWVLLKKGFRIVFATRKPVKDNHVSYEDLRLKGLKEFSLIVNTTPLGMYPHTDDFPDIPYQTIDTHHTFFDLIYNPAETLFLKYAKERGAKVINGLYMLEQQAEKAWEIWKPFGN